jgi:hypothetical protein
MLKTTILAAAALSFVALGAPTAYAGHGGGGGGGGGGGHHGGGGGGGGHHGGGGGHHGSHNKWNNGHIWLNYSWYPSCHYETKKIRIKVWDRYGNPHFKWVWRDVKVC